MHTPSKSIEVPTLSINATLYNDRPMPSHVRIEQRIVAALIAHMSARGTKYRRDSSRLKITSIALFASVQGSDVAPSHTERNAFDAEVYE